MTPCDDLRQAPAVTRTHACHELAEQVQAHSWAALVRLALWGATHTGLPHPVQSGRTPQNATSIAAPKQQLV